MASEGSETMVVEFDREDDDRWICEFVQYPGVLAYGDTQLESFKNASEVLEEFLATNY